MDFGHLGFGVLMVNGEMIGDRTGMHDVMNLLVVLMVLKMWGEVNRRIHKNDFH